MEEIKARVTAILETISKKEFLAWFQQVYERSKTCIEREEERMLETNKKSFLICKTGILIAPIPELFEYNM